MKELYEKKVYAYITREKEGQTQLLICTHQGGQEAGVQVPGGTVRQGETLEYALLRNIQEDSGLRQVSLGHLVAEELIYVKDKNEYQKRHFYHVTLPESSVDVWEHRLENDGKNNASVLSYMWANIEKCPLLVEKQGSYIHLVEKQYMKAVSY